MPSAPFPAGGGAVREAVGVSRTDNLAEMTLVESPGIFPRRAARHLRWSPALRRLLRNAGPERTDREVTVARAVHITEPRAPYLLPM
jgi:hypothetical protein